MITIYYDPVINPVPDGKIGSWVQEEIIHLLEGEGDHEVTVATFECLQVVSSVDHLYGPVRGDFSGEPYLLGDLDPTTAPSDAFRRLVDASKKRLWTIWAIS